MFSETIQPVRFDFYPGNVDAVEIGSGSGRIKCIVNKNRYVPTQSELVKRPQKIGYDNCKPCAGEGKVSAVYSDHFHIETTLTTPVLLKNITVYAKRDRLLKSPFKFRFGYVPHRVLQEKSFNRLSMRIVLHSFTFWPSVGGVESVAHTLATGFCQAGHQVAVVTDTLSDEERDVPYSVCRRSPQAKIAQLIASSDIVHSYGTSARYFPLAMKHRKPFVWTHPTYQLQSIDGFGFIDGSPAPLSPWPSIFHHWRHFGMKKALVGGAKLLVKRMIANLVSSNVAITEHQARRQPLPNQRVIYNPCSLAHFSAEDAVKAQWELENSDATFTFLGRLIKEKGVDDLLRALALLNERRSDDKRTLKIIGDGPERERLEGLASDLGIMHLTKWAGQKAGDALVAEVRRAGICVLPSAWEEPMGIAALELMAAGKPLVVSQVGGLSECAAEAALTFPNGNYRELARVMDILSSDAVLQRELMLKALERIKLFEPDRLIEEYLQLFKEILGASAKTVCRENWVSEGYKKTG